MKYYIAALLLVGSVAIAKADYHSCKWDADTWLQQCLRRAAENRSGNVGDASCRSYHAGMIRACNNLRR
jgi:hypothetical protein